MRHLASQVVTSVHCSTVCLTVLLTVPLHDPLPFRTVRTTRGVGIGRLPRNVPPVARRRATVSKSAPTPRIAASRVTQSTNAGHVLVRNVFPGKQLRAQPEHLRQPLHLRLLGAKATRRRRSASRLRKTTTPIRGVQVFRP